MPYLVLHDEEMNAKTGEGRDRSRSDMLVGALDAMEHDGYALVAIVPANDGEGGASYVFHRPGPTPGT
jgi:hypothetical protein